MNVLQINNVDRQGGAARSMMRLHRELLKKKHHSRLLVGRRLDGNDSLVSTIAEIGERERSLADRFFDRFGTRMEHLFGIHPWTARSSLKIARTALYRWADVIVLRNLHIEYFNLWGLPGLAAGKPLIWRLPDMWPLTGHCAFSYSCERWKSGCHHCPLLNGHGSAYVEPRPTRWDCTRRVWQAKQRIYRRTPLHIVVNSAWMKACVQQSILKDAISISTISNGVDLNVFRPIPRNKARRRLGLPQEAPIVLCAAAGLGHHRKGYRYAAQAMAQLQSSGERAPMLITMGKPQGVDRAFPLRKARHFGFIEDEGAQALLYAAADVLLCTTLAEGQPQVALEALACGTPIVTFDLGPMPELARPGATGYLAKPRQANDLARGVRLLLEDKAQLDRMGRRCRAVAEQEFSPGLQAARFIKLFERTLEDHSGGQRLKNIHTFSIPLHTSHRV